MIRNATISDLPEIMELFKIVLKDMEHPTLNQYDWSDLKKAMIDLGSNPDNKLGYPQLIVKEVDGKVAAYAGTYPSDFQEDLDAINKILKKHQMKDLDLFGDETLENEWYLDCLVTGKDYRGQGIGKELLEAVYKQAQDAGYPVVGLNCDQDNDFARAIYEKQGFKTVTEIDIVGHTYDHMQKPV